MLYNYSHVLIFAAVGIGFVFVTLLVGSFVRPSVPTLEKLSTYECGELPVGSAWMNFNIRFYVVALIFVVFDVEMAFMFPVARVYRDLVNEGKAGMALFEVFLFVAILLVGFVYAWAKGDLDWVKKLVADVREQRSTTTQTS
jgi:NADH-quinone oxidoreductase subunit A